MAYNDYGAFVYKNGERRRDKEDAPAFASDKEIFGTDIGNVPSALRIFVSLVEGKKYGRELDWFEHIHHGVCGDDSIRVVCHKQGLPQIVEATDDGIKEIKFYDENEVDYFEYDTFGFEYKGYHFLFRSGKPYKVEMDEPDGTHWLCEYDYQYGAGFENE